MTDPPLSAIPRKRLVYVVEDDPEVGRLIGRALDDYEFVTRIFRTGNDLLRQMKRESAELCIVDLGLPDMDGMQLVREIEEKFDSAILILTGRLDVSDRVLGLELGADDYMVKPFEPRELVARARSILRRWNRMPAIDGLRKQGRARFADWLFDVGANLLIDKDGRRIELSVSEAALLAAFLDAPNRILTRDQLLGDREVEPFDRSIDVRVSRLRRKLADNSQNPRLIKTIYGSGYMLLAAVEWV